MDADQQHSTMMAQTSSESQSFKRFFPDSSVHYGPKLKTVQCKVMFKNSQVGIIIIIRLIMRNSNHTG